MSGKFWRFLILGTLGVLITACAHHAEKVDPRTDDANTPATSFSADDVVSPAAAFEAGPLAVGMQKDGKMVVAGSTRSLTGQSNFAVARYNPDGTLDTSFNGDGMAVSSIRSASHTGMSVAIQADHKIVVVGYLGPPGSHDFAVERYRPDGSQDPSFGSNGSVLTSLSDGNDEALAVAIQDDGRIVVAGFGASAFELVRYMPDGSRDQSFGTAGIALTSPGQNADAWGVALQADGKIVVAGGAGMTALARYSSNGKLDPSFDGDGIAVTDVGPRHDQAHALVVQKDGKIIVGGFFDNPTSGGFSVVRYKPDGSLDKSFGTNGILKTQIETVGDSAYTVMVQPDGSVVTTSAQSGTGEITVTRYDANGGRQDD